MRKEREVLDLILGVTSCTLPFKNRKTQFNIPSKIVEWNVRFHELYVTSPLARLHTWGKVETYNLQLRLMTIAITIKSEETKVPGKMSKILNHEGRGRGWGYEGCTK